MKLLFKVCLLCCLVLPLSSWAQIKTNVKTKGIDRYQPLDPPTRKAKQEPKITTTTPEITTPTVSPTLKNTLGEQLTSLIARAKVIKMYEVESFVNEDPIAATLDGFRILQTATLTNAQFIEAKRLISSETTYYITEDVKQCLFLPKMGLQFIDGKDTANILVSFKCDLARFRQQGNRITLNSDYGHDELIAFFNSVFTTQPYAYQDMSMAVKIPTAKPIYYTVQFGEGWFLVAQKASNTYHTKISVNDLCRWNKVDKNEALTNQRYLRNGETIIVGFRR